MDGDILEVGLKESVNCQSTRVDGLWMDVTTSVFASAVTVKSKYDEVNLFFYLGTVAGR